MKLVIQKDESGEPFINFSVSGLVEAIRENKWFKEFFGTIFSLTNKSNVKVDNIGYKLNQIQKEKEERFNTLFTAVNNIIRENKKEQKIREMKFNMVEISLLLLFILEFITQYFNF